MIIFFFIIIFFNQSLFSEEFDKIKGAELILSNKVSLNLKIEDIQKSKKNIDLATYIIENDSSASKLLTALIRKAKSGAKVRILLDLYMNFSNIDILNEAALAAGKDLEVKFIFKMLPPEDIGLLVFNECLSGNLNSEIVIQKTPKICGSTYQDIKVASKVLLYKYFGINSFTSINKKLIESAIMSKDFEYLANLIGSNEMSKLDQSRSKHGIKINQWIMAVIFSSSFIEQIQSPIERQILRIIANPMSTTLKEMSSGFHVKSLNIDGKTAYFGGRNIGEPYASDDVILPKSQGPMHLFSDVEARIIFNKNEIFKDKYFERFWSSGISLSEVNETFYYDKYLFYKLHKIDCLKFSKSIRENCEKVIEYKIASEYYNILNSQRVVNSAQDLRQKIIKNKSSKILNIPSRKIKYMVSGPSKSVENNLIGEVFLNTIKTSCDLLIFSPYLFPPYAIRKAFFERINSTTCLTKIITGTVLGSDFSILGFLGTSLLKPIEEHAKTKGIQRLITYWEGQKYLHHKIFVTKKDLFVTSSNLDMRSFYLDTNNLVQFELLPAQSKFIHKLEKGIYLNSNFTEKENEYVSTNQLLDKLQQDLGVEIKNSEQFRIHLDRILGYIYQESKFEMEHAVYLPDSKLDINFNFL